MRLPGRPSPLLVEAALVALLVAAVLPCLVTLVLPLSPDAAPEGPGLVALSSALEKAHRCLQGDDCQRGAGGAMGVATALSVSVALPPLPAAPPAPAAPCPPPPSGSTPAAISRRL